MIPLMNQLPNDTQLSSLTTLSDQLFKEETEVLRLEVELKKAKQRRDTLANQVIPEAMREIGVLQFRTAQCNIEIKEVLAVQPLADNRPLVLQEVDRLGSGHLIKTTITVPFNRGEGEMADELSRELRERGLETKQEQKIEPATLRKFVKDRLEEGEEVDVDLFGVRLFHQAVIKDGAPSAPIFD